MERDDKFAQLVKAACEASESSFPSPDFERRVMIEVARRAIERARRRARFNLVASLSAISITAAACVTAVVVWFPSQLVVSVDLDTVLENMVATIRALLP
jgi:hypothetical protein